MRAIDADALKYRRMEYGAHDDVPMDERKNGILYLLKEDIDDAPTIDAVPVVRCEYCRWGKEKSGNIECNVDRNVPPEYHGYDWFCPNGERRESGE